jgi:hypothetical protein
VGRKKRQIFVSPGDGRFPAGELMRRDPQLFATSAILVGAEAHSHTAPPKSPSEEVLGGRFLFN